MSNYIELKEFAENAGCEVRVNEPMSEHTTFKIGGRAALFIYPEKEQSFAELVKKAKETGVAINIVGNGSNMLVCDDDLDSVFVNLGKAFNKVELVDETTILCGAGVNLSSLCKFACEHSLTGIEFAFGIPGSVGGAAFMNAGAYEGEIGNVIKYCEHVDANGCKGVLSHDEINFSYRNTSYKTNGCFVTKVCVELRKGDKSEIQSRMDDYMARRRDKQPLEYPSAGSFFKRPAGHFAGALIEQCALKGKTIGGAQISEKHAGFIINVGGATYKDVIELMEYTQKTVLREKGVALEPEVLIIKNN